jgi:hypothetical protein
MNRNLRLLNRIVRCKFATSRASPSAVQGQLLLPAHRQRHLTTKSGNDDDREFFFQQLQEINQERDSLFGKEPTSKQQPTASGRDNHAFFEEQMNELNHQDPKHVFDSQEQQAMEELNHEQESLFPHSDEVLEEMKEEREDLYQFTDDERDAWTGAGTISSDVLQQIRRARDLQQGQPRNDSLPPQDPSSAHSDFTHVTQDGNSVHMVDVGQKEVTQRMARAQCKVIFPPEVMEAFQSYNGELIGPKGPIFATAKIAGIMAAKSVLFENQISLQYPSLVDSHSLIACVLERQVI